MGKLYKGAARPSRIAAALLVVDKSADVAFAMMSAIGDRMVVTRGLR